MTTNGSVFHADVSLGAKPDDLTFDGTADALFQNTRGTSNGTDQAVFLDSNENGSGFAFNSYGPVNQTVFVVTNDPNGAATLAPANGAAPHSGSNQGQFFLISHGDYNGNGSDDALFQNPTTGE